MRICIKVGTSTLAHPSGHLNIRQVENLCKVISDLKNAGNQVVLVSSGAIGMGVGKLGLKQRPSDMPTKQAAAAVGQCELMYIYDKAFGAYNHTVAQILLTGDDFDHPERLGNFRNTLFRLLELDALPIINENDTIVTDEISNWENNWEDVSSFFQFSGDIRRIMYTTNIIEGLNRQYRKVTKTKSVFPSDTALEKMLFLASRNVTKKWTQRYRNWDQVLNQLILLYDERLTAYL